MSNIIYKKGNLKEVIVSQLMAGMRDVTNFVNDISEHCKCSVQSVYTAMHELALDEIVVIHGKHISLSLIWITKKKEEIVLAEQVYKNMNLLLQIFENIFENKLTTKIKALSEKRSGKIAVNRFIFKSISDLDLFWTQAYTILLNKNDNYNAQYLITPHDFFLYARPATDDFWLNNNVKNKAVTRLIVTYTSPVDRLVILARKKAHGKQIEYLLDHNPLKTKSNIYINVVGDYIFKATFDMSINKKLEAQIHQIKKLPISDTELQSMQEIINMKGRFVFTVENNKVKANIYRNKLKKYFVITDPSKL